MKTLFMHLVVAIATFGIAAGASWTLQKAGSPDDKGAAPTGRKPHATHEEPGALPDSATSSRPRKDTVTERAIRAAVHPTYTPGVEETVKLASSLRDRAAVLREREDQMSARQRQLELVIENIRSERAAIDESRAQLDAALQAAEDRVADVQ